MTALTVDAVGPLAVLEDRGRVGLAHLGVGRSGAADRASYELANRLTGNRPGAAVIEATLGQLAFHTDETLLVAVTGAPLDIRCGDRSHAVNTSFRVPPGAAVTLGLPAAGLRSYVSVRGGIGGDPVLGSLSWDTMAQLGPPPLRPGDVLRVGDEADGGAGRRPGPGRAPRLGTDRAPAAAGTTRRLVHRRGGRPAGRPGLHRHLGHRPGGRPAGRTRAAAAGHGELPSEGVVVGALQVPTRGRPTLFLADHPVTGGYPVIGVVPTAWVDRAAQAVPGQAGPLPAAPRLRLSPDDRTGPSDGVSR